MSRFPIEDPWIHEYLLSKHLLFFQTFIYCHSFESFEELRKSCVFAIKIPRYLKYFTVHFFVEVWKPLSSNFIANLNPLFEWNKNRANKIMVSIENGTKFVVFPFVNVAFLRFIITNLSIVNVWDILNRAWRNYDENEIDYATTICKTRMFCYRCIFVWPQSYLNCLLAEKLMTKNFL